MAALSTERVPSVQKRTVSRYRLQLAASVKAYKGGACMVIQSGTGKGYAAPADDAKIGRVVGKFLETVDNSAGAIGALSVLVDFGRERTIYPFVNDTDDLLDATDREGPAYVLDDQTVSATVSTAISGVLFEVDANGVAWVEVDAPFAGPAGSLSDVAPVDPSSSAASAGSATTAARQDHLHHIALATTSAEGLASAAQITALGRLAAPTVMLFDLQAAQALAADALAEHSCLVVATGDTFSAFYVVSDAALTGDPTNNAVLTIKKRDGAGGGASSMAALTTTANWTAFVPKTFGAVSGGAVAAGSVLTLTIAKGGTGVIVPACKIYGVKAVA